VSDTTGLEDGLKSSVLGSRLDHGRVLVGLQVVVRGSKHACSVVVSL
jgi:hypothetical protein